LGYRSKKNYWATGLGLGRVSNPLVHPIVWCIVKCDP